MVGVELLGYNGLQKRARRTLSLSRADQNIAQTWQLDELLQGCVTTSGLSTSTAACSPDTVPHGSSLWHALSPHRRLFSHLAQPLTALCGGRRFTV